MNKLLYYICMAMAMSVVCNANALNRQQFQPDTTLLGYTSDSMGNEYEVIKIKQKYVRPEILPDSVTKSIDEMVGYIMANYTTDKDRLWAIYSWICTNVKYSYSALDVQNRYHDFALADYTFKKKIGVCANYAELFHQLAKKMGIESYTLSGYSVKHEASDNPRHAWVICILDGQPYAFDPTWGAGFYNKEKKKFTFQFNRNWFAVGMDDKLYTSTHFSPTSYFQCTSSPNTFKNRFYDATTSEDGGDYVWQDSLKHYTQVADSLERAVFGLRDMNKYLVISLGIPNELSLRKQGLTGYYNNVFKPAKSYKKTFKNDINYQKHLIENLKDIRIANILDKQADSLVQISSKWEYLWNTSQTSEHWIELEKDAQSIVDRLNKIETNNSLYKDIIKELKHFANSYLEYPSNKGICIRNHKAKAYKTVGKQTHTSRYTIEKDLFKQKERKDHETCSLTKIVRKKEIEFLFDSFRNGQRRHYTIKLPIMQELF